MSFAQVGRMIEKYSDEYASAGSSESTRSGVSIRIVPPGAASPAGARGRTLTQTRPSATTTS
jgi:hypothetical protein